MKSQAIKTKHRSINDIRKPRKPKSLTIKQHYAHVIALCTNYLEQKLTVNNCIDTILFADSHGMERLSRLTAMFIDVNFEMVFTSDEFLELNTSQLIALMPLLLYNEMSEDDMKNAVLLWSKYKQAERKKSSHLMRPNYKTLMERAKNPFRNQEDCARDVTPVTVLTDQIEDATDESDETDAMPPPPPPPSISSQD